MAPPPFGYVPAFVRIALFIVHLFIFQIAYFLNAINEHSISSRYEMDLNNRMKELGDDAGQIFSLIRWTVRSQYGYHPKLEDWPKWAKDRMNEVMRDLKQKQMELLDEFGMLSDDE